MKKLLPSLLISASLVIPAEASAGNEQRLLREHQGCLELANGNCYPMYEYTLGAAFMGGGTSTLDKRPGQREIEPNPSWFYRKKNQIGYTVNVGDTIWGICTNLISYINSITIGGQIIATAEDVQKCIRVNGEKIQIGGDISYPRY